MEDLAVRRRMRKCKDLFSKFSLWRSPSWISLDVEPAGVVVIGSPNSLSPTFAVGIEKQLILIWPRSQILYPQQKLVKKRL
jgi:hypothetical protein